MYHALWSVAQTSLHAQCARIDVIMRVRIVGTLVGQWCENKQMSIKLNVPSLYFKSL